MDVEKSARVALASPPEYFRLCERELRGVHDGIFIVLYGGYAVHSSLNLGIRYLIPIIPFIFILSAGVWKKWVMQLRLPAATATLDAAAAMTKSVAASLMKYTVLIVLLVWLFCETLFAAPYFLSYFNESAVAFGTGITMRRIPITTGGRTSCGSRHG